MKKYIYILFTFLMVLVGCQKDAETVIEKKGTGLLRMEQPSVQSETEIPVITTKGSFGMDGNAFAIRINQRQEDGTYEISNTFESYTAMLDAGMPLVLPIGDYQVIASSYNPDEIEERVSEMPYFEGIQPFIIEEKTITTVEPIKCTFESVGVELRLSEQLKERLDKVPTDTYSVTVWNGTVFWTFDEENAVKPAYFRDEDKELIVKVNIRLNGLDYPERTYYVTNPATEQVALGEYYIITLDAGEDEQQITTKCLER